MRSNEAVLQSQVHQALPLGLAHHGMLWEGAGSIQHQTTATLGPVAFMQGTRYFCLTFKWDFGGRNLPQHNPEAGRRQARVSAFIPPCCPPF